MGTNFQLERIAANAGRPRRETLNGREYLVAPATLIVGDSVLNGSQGPLLYPRDQVESRPHDWNGMPLVAWHPTKVVNGQEVNVSARDPEILNEWGLGQFFRANELPTHNSGNLDGEAWFDVLNVQAVDAKLQSKRVASIMPRLLSGKPIELSTGLFTENVPQRGHTVNGDFYSHVATNYRPDHVAILPDERGACSTGDGCGVNNARMCWGKPCDEQGNIEVSPERVQELKTEHSISNPGGRHWDKAKSEHLDAGGTEKMFHSDMEKLYGGSVDLRKQAGAHKQPQRVDNNSSKQSIWNRLGQMLGIGPADGSATANAEQPSSDIDPAKACQIMKDGTANGQPLTDDQRGMFGAACGETDNASLLPATELDMTDNDRMCWGHPCSGSTEKAVAGALKASKETEGAQGHSQLYAAHTIAARKHGVAAEALRKSGNERGAKIHETSQQEHKDLSDFHGGRINTNQEYQMPLTSNQRQSIVKDLVTNCACKIKPEVLNALDDEALVQTVNNAKLVLVVNAHRSGKLGGTRNAEGEGEAVPGVPWPQLAKTLGIDIDPRTDPVGFTGAMKTALDAASSKLGGASPPPPPMADEPTTAAEDDPMEPDEDDKMTGNKKTIDEKTFPREVREDLAYARNMRRREKEGLVRNLLGDVPTADRQRIGDVLFKKGIDELRTLQALRPQQTANRQAPQEPTVNWALAGGSALVGNDVEINEAELAEAISLMTTNYYGVDEKAKVTA